MLPKLQRLNLKTDFKQVVSGQKVESNLIKLFYQPGEKGQPRVGISVSAKVFKKAAQRNRARRLLSKGFEDLYPALADGVKIIAMPKMGILEKSSEEVGRELEELLEQHGLIKSKIKS